MLRRAYGSKDASATAHHAPTPRVQPRWQHSGSSAARIRARHSCGLRCVPMLRPAEPGCSCPGAPGRRFQVMHPIVPVPAACWCGRARPPHCDLSVGSCQHCPHVIAANTGDHSWINGRLSDWRFRFAAAYFGTCLATVVHQVVNEAIEYLQKQILLTINEIAIRMPLSDSTITAEKPVD